ncbi:DUF2798 domain-containing protein [Halomonas organivorans]|uniref:DUF2798 domain-containing protein n=1 Tax=Halomonas organivorans TaxID=257772 RepID=A0A7W5C2Q3_9GAMM|nr:DUF2798 domain-containing protein [Halomonas organivorans]MBB3142663.1 hypothetical protein [Halomonas organivorans]
MSTPSSSQRTADGNVTRPRRGIPPRFAPLVFAFYMSALMTLLMSLVITAVNGGLGPDYLAAVGRAYVRAMPVAFLGVLTVRPLVLRLVKWTLAGEEQR